MFRVVLFEGNKRDRFNGIMTKFLLMSSLSMYLYYFVVISEYVTYATADVKEFLV